MAEGKPFGGLDRVPPWGDWLIALVVAIVLFNVHITSSGDALSGVRGVGGVSAPGISEAGRTSFYAAIAIVGAVLAAGTLVVIVLPAGLARQAAAAFRTFGLLAASGIAGLLLDYPDGPVRTVELLAYVAMVVATIRFIRLGVAASGLARSNGGSHRRER
jgi:hypothetical protein